MLYKSTYTDPYLFRTEPYLKSRNFCIDQKIVRRFGPLPCKSRGPPSQQSRVTGLHRVTNVKKPCILYSQWYQGLSTVQMNWWTKKVVYIHRWRNQIKSSASLSSTYEVEIYISRYGCIVHRYMYCLIMFLIISFCFIITFCYFRMVYLEWLFSRVQKFTCA